MKRIKSGLSVRTATLRPSPSLAYNGLTKMTPSARKLDAGVPTATGRDAIMALMSKYPADLQIDWNPEEAVVAGSGDLASFDRSKCKVLKGPTATGQHCPEGWTIYPVPGPSFKGTDARADWHYLNWVDRYDTLGFGKTCRLYSEQDRIRC